MKKKIKLYSKTNSIQWYLFKTRIGSEHYPDDVRRLWSEEPLYDKNGKEYKLNPFDWENELNKYELIESK
tara:strand:- start:863 stop:1072 length:210 start_codon:yes stop_codon:yes gene_type:complete